MKVIYEAQPLTIKVENDTLEMLRVVARSLVNHPEGRKCRYTYSKKDREVFAMVDVASMGNANWISVCAQDDPNKAEAWRLITKALELLEEAERKENENLSK